MTVVPSIDPARFLEEQLSQASPDLLRQMLSTFINTLPSASVRQASSLLEERKERQTDSPRLGTT